MSKDLTFSVATLGCKVNQYDSWRLCRQLREYGFRQVPFGVPADVVIINSCTVTHVADAKSRKMVSRARAASPSGLVVLTGCSAELLNRQGSTLPAADLIAGNAEKEDLIRLILEKVETLTSARSSGAHSPYGDDYVDDPDGVHERIRGFLKVQEGCDKFCTFCVLPYTRGAPRSKPIGDVLEEATEMVSLFGFREIVLTGVCLSLWGKEWGLSLNDLIAQVQTVPGLLRIRLSSLDPRDLSPDLVRRWADLPLLAPHFHISLQSGDDEVLTNMGRGHTTAYYERLIETVRETVPDATITTDILTGFPGETDRQFENTVNFVRKMNFLKVHAFRFSPRPGTPAADWKPFVPPSVAQERCQRLTDVSRQNWRKVVQRFMGQERPVLVERSDQCGNGWANSGLTDNYLRVRWQTADPRLPGSLVTVLLDRVGQEGEWIVGQEVGV